MAKKKQDEPSDWDAPEDTKKKPEAKHKATKLNIEEVDPGEPSKSKFRPGKASRRQKTRFILLTGVPKVRKTGSVSTLPRNRTKWLISDSNCIATLDLLGRLPPPENLYEVTSLEEAILFLEEVLQMLETEGIEAFDTDYLAVDSVTAFADWHQQAIAKNTNQSYMGESKENNGWQQFNAEFGRFLDLLAKVSQYLTVVCIGHIRESTFKKKGQYSTLSLPPQMAEKLARLANWILYATLDEVVMDGDVEPETNEFVSVEEQPDGTKRWFENVIHTRPINNVVCSVNSPLAAREPANIYALLK